MGNTPLWGVAHAVGGWGALGLRTSPTRQVGWDPAWWVGEVRKPSAPHPPTAWATPHSGVLPTPQVGRDQLPLSHKPTASVREPLPSMTEATSMAGSGLSGTWVFFCSRVKSAKAHCLSFANQKFNIRTATESF